MNRPAVRVVLAVLVLLVGYLAGTLAPRASALEGSAELVREVKAIRLELQGIRHALEKH